MFFKDITTDKEVNETLTNIEIYTSLSSLNTEVTLCTPKAHSPNYKAYTFVIWD